jgi:hypothetical protein
MLSFFESQKITDDLPYQSSLTSGIAVLGIITLVRAILVLGGSKISLLVTCSA